MKTKFSNFTKAFILGDIIIFNIAFLLGFALRFFFNFVYIQSIYQRYIFLAFIFNALWVVLIYSNLHKNIRVLNLTRLILQPLSMIFLHALILGFILYATKGEFYSRKMLLYTYTFLSVLIISYRLFYYRRYYNKRMQGIDSINLVIIGYNEISKNLKNLIEKHPKYGFKILGFFTNKKVNDVNVLGKLEDLEWYLSKNKVDEVFCTLPLNRIEDIQEMMLTADSFLSRFRLVTNLGGIFNREIHIESLEQLSIFSFREEPLDNVENQIAKRFFDIIFSLIVIIFIFPWLFPILMILIKLESKGPVFFKQKRSGLNNRDFECLKFRTMFINDESGIKQAHKNDQRITKIGKILRITNLDELPQFFNVLFGEMSVVGPRPHMLFHTQKYRNIIRNYMVRHYVKPGITGYAQVKGFRGETKNDEDMIKRIEADIYYIENWSFFLDFKIILLTIVNMIKGEENAF